MQNKQVATIITGSSKYTTVSIEDLKGLRVPEQFALLEGSGYHRGAENIFNHTFVSEWHLIQNADEGGYVAEKYVDLFSTEKLTVPFILQERCGTVIDEYNFNLIYYWDSDPARLIAQCWIRGGEKETAFTMPISERFVFDGFHFMVNDPAKYILTTHDIRCFEERLSLRFSDLTRIVPLSNGRFALATHVYDNGKAWEGFPVCGDCDEAQYKTAIIHYLYDGVDYDASYEIGRDDNLTFPTYETTKAWADRIGVKLGQFLC